MGSNIHLSPHNGQELALLISGVCANSTVLCRDCDLDRIKDSFSEVFAVELFSLQIVEVEDLKQLMSIVRLQDEKFFRLNNDRAPVHSTEVLLMARDLRGEVRRANSDILLAMKAVLDGKNESHYANEEGRVVQNVQKKGGPVEGAEIDIKCKLPKDEEISPDGQSSDSSTRSLEQPSPKVDNLSKLSTSSKDPVDSKPFQNVPSKLCHGETAVQPKHDGFGEESADDDKELISCKRKNVSNCDEVPAKKDRLREL
ncbi:hypothetical protein KIN20_004229 [Parelaphostrongylus tenuis]|uniref:Uncharacterized protein n=1 Tax=Parelaphostrongylus tenuis TaxID=148309 RepID=A0AAD5QJ53_PARTN|nr:hypothetical protein KIN20_004229 [Parelaphostrongylus tenuis]